MRVTMILASCMLFVALFSPVELFKFSKHKSVTATQPAPVPPQAPISESLEAERLYQPMFLAPPRYYPLPADLVRQPMPLPLEAPPTAGKGFELHATKTFGKGLENAPASPPILPFAPQEPLIQSAQPQSIAYLVVRPVQPQYQALYESGYRYNNYYQPAPLAQPALRPPIKQEEYATKGNRQTTEEQAGQIIQTIEQQHEQQQIEEPHAQLNQQQVLTHQQQQPALVVPVAPGKEHKIRAMLDKLMSKLTLGSSYQVVGEEFVVPQQPAQRQPQPQPQPQQQIQQVQQQPIQIEQQQHHVVEDQRQEQQLEQQRDNGFDDAVKQPVKIQQQDQQIIEQQQHQQQVKEEQLQQNLAEHDLARHRQQQAIKGDQEPQRQEPDALKGLKRGQLQQQQIQFANQEPIRQEAKGTY